MPPELCKPSRSNEIDGVIVSVPGEDTAVAKMGRQFARGVAFHADGHRRCALIELRRILDAIERESRNRQQAIDQVLDQFALVLLENFVRGKNRFAPRRHRRIVVTARLGDVVNRRDQPRQAFMVLRSRFPTVWQLLSAGAEFVGTKPLQLLTLAEENAEVWAEELVAGTRQEVAIESANINRPMRRVMYGVDERHGTRFMRQPHNFLNIVDGANGVGRPSHRYHAGVAANFRREVKHIKRAIGWLDVSGANLHPTLLEANPGRNICVVIEATHQQLVPALQLPTQGATQGEGQRRHVGAEDHFIACAVEEVRHGGTRIGNHLISALTGDERPAGVCIVPGKIIGDRVNHALRDLRAARGIEEHGRPPVHRLMQRRKLSPHPIHIQLARYGSSCTRRHNQELLTAVRKSASKPYAVASNPGSCSVMINSGKTSVAKLMTDDVPFTSASGSESLSR